MRYSLNVRRRMRTFDLLRFSFRGLISSFSHSAWNFPKFFLSHEFAKSLQGNVRKPSRKGKMQYALMKTRKELSWMRKQDKMRKDQLVKRKLPNWFNRKIFDAFLVSWRKETVWWIQYLPSTLGCVVHIITMHILLSSRC